MAKDLFILQASSGNQDFCSDDLTLWNQIIALVVLSFSMGIQKIGRHVSGVSSDCRRVSYSSNVDNMVLEENQASGTSFEDDSDDCEFEEVRCELGVLEGQLCNIPFELYDLPDLREILSLDTWNSCLTEDERLIWTNRLFG